MCHKVSVNKQFPIIENCHYLLLVEKIFLLMEAPLCSLWRSVCLVYRVDMSRCNCNSLIYGAYFYNNNNEQWTHTSAIKWWQKNNRVIASKKWLIKKISYCCQRRKKVYPYGTTINICRRFAQYTFVYNFLLPFLHMQCCNLQILQWLKKSFHIFYEIKHKN